MSGDDIKALLEKAKESLDVARDLVQGGHAASACDWANEFIRAAETYLKAIDSKRI